MRNLRVPTRANNSNALKFGIALAVIGLMLCVVWLATHLTLAPSGSGPKLVVDQERIDLGTLVYRERARAVFTLKNIGDQPLQIAPQKIQTKLLEGC